MEPTSPTHPPVDPPVLGEHAGHVIYPMPAFVRVTTPDPVALSAFFTTALDFAIVYAATFGDGPPALVHLRRAKYQDILVTPGPSTDATGADVTLVFGAGDADAVDALAARVEGAAPGATSGPVDTPWNTRDLRVRDPDGRTWSFTGRGRAPAAATVDDALRRAIGRGTRGS